MRAAKLKIAIQRSGRLSDSSLDLLHKCDIRFDNGLGKLKSVAHNFPLEILFIRDDDIPRYVEDAVADVGIVGENVLAEQASSLTRLEKLGFGRCRLSVAVPNAFEYTNISSLAGKRIATSYPGLLANFLRENSVDAEIHSISGSVEIAPSVGLADAVCDLVSSGNTLFSNGLSEVKVIMESEATLIARSGLNSATQAVLDSLMFRLRAVNAARENKYIMLNAPNAKLPEIQLLLPGLKSPTITPLGKSGWSSVQSVIGRSDVWKVVEKVKKVGAEGVLVVSIDQMIR